MSSLGTTSLPDVPSRVGKVLLVRENPVTRRCVLDVSLAPLAPTCPYEQRKTISEPSFPTHLQELF